VLLLLNGMITAVAAVVDAGRISEVVIITGITGTVIPMVAAITVTTGTATAAITATPVSKNVFNTETCFSNFIRFLNIVLSAKAHYSRILCG
jgi:archaellum biogenesis protein FlaJ (TadC family)